MRGKGLALFTSKKMRWMTLGAASWVCCGSIAGNLPGGGCPWKTRVWCWCWCRVVSWLDVGFEKGAALMLWLVVETQLFFGSSQYRLVR